MISGYVNEALEPVIEIGLKGSDGLTQIAAVVDTGFSGELCLSDPLIEASITFQRFSTFEFFVHTGNQTANRP